MDMNLTFSVTARCYVYEKGDNENYKKEDIILEFDETTAMNFLFRFAPYAFMLNGYKIIFHMNGTSVDGLQLIDEDSIYVVSNLNQVFSEVYQGYYNIITMKKISGILNYDFDSYKEEEVKDEFEG